LAEQETTGIKPDDGASTSDVLLNTSADVGLRTAEATVSDPHAEEHEALLELIRSQPGLAESSFDGPSVEPLKEIAKLGTTYEETQPDELAETLLERVLAVPLPQPSQLSTEASQQVASAVMALSADASVPTLVEDEAPSAAPAAPATSTEPAARGVTAFDPRPELTDALTASNGQSLATLLGASGSVTAAQEISPPPTSKESEAGQAIARPHPFASPSRVNSFPEAVNEMHTGD